MCTFGTGIFAVGAGAAGLAAGAGAATGTSGAAVLAVGAGTAVGAGLIFGGIASKIITSNQYNLQFNRIATAVEVIGACVIVGLVVAATVYAAYACKNPIQEKGSENNEIISNNNKDDSIISDEFSKEESINEKIISTNPNEEPIEEPNIKGPNIEEPNIKGPNIGEPNIKGPIEEPIGEPINKDGLMQYSKNELIGKSGKYLPKEMKLYFKDDPLVNQMFSEDSEIKLLEDDRGITEEEVNNLFKKSNLQLGTNEPYQHTKFLTTKSPENVKLAAVLFEPSAINKGNYIVLFIYRDGLEYKYVCDYLWPIGEEPIIGIGPIIDIDSFG